MEAYSKRVKGESSTLPQLDAQGDSEPDNDEQ